MLAPNLFFLRQASVYPATTTTTRRTMASTASSSSPTPTDNNNSHENSKSKSSSLQDFNFHHVLTQVGKTVFRPGGMPATQLLHDWSHLTADDTALEYSAGLASSAMALAQSRHCKVDVLTSTNNVGRVQDNIAKQQQQELQDLITVIPCQEDTPNILNVNLNNNDQHYQAAILEATLTHASLDEKRRILTQLQPHVDQVLLHNVCLVGDNTNTANNDKILNDIGSALGTCAFHPLTVEGWKQLVTDCGFVVENLQTGPLASMNPKTMVQDEGLRRVAKILWNLLTHKEWRTIVVRAKNVMAQHDDQLGYIVVQATTQKEAK